MTQVKLRCIVVALCTILVASCGGSSATKDSIASRAAVEDRGLSSDEMNAIDSSARTQGVDDDGSFAGSALGDPDDPDGPLSVRLIYFDYDSSSVRSEFRGSIEAHAAYLAGNPGESITLEGHADERGSREYNLALGEKRALAVRKQLVLFGASAGQVHAVSYGEERPAIDGHDEGSYGLNRRVEILY
ncbi:MAG: peptidoglycan-associated lipoprotein Pal [Proteobacteria bacterium]|nr:MAG: peptidoglycan-associated lipoprotein Pal [Pseudomonadota bacterium]